jgi:hypothetical protein
VQVSFVTVPKYLNADTFSKNLLAVSKLYFVLHFGEETVFTSRPTSPLVWQSTIYTLRTYDGVSKSFRTDRLERELQMVELSATRCSCISLCEFYRHNPSCSFSKSVYCCKRIFRYRLSPETFGYTLVCFVGELYLSMLQCSCFVIYKTD